jgi:hypothetical protein
MASHKEEWRRLKEEVGKNAGSTLPPKEYSWNPMERRAYATKNNPDGGLGDSCLVHKNV